MIKETTLNKKESAEGSQPQATQPLMRNNFVMMAVAAVLIVLGFVLMVGEPSGTDAFNPGIFSARRIVVGPLLSFIGYVLMGVAIIIKPKER